MNTIRVKNYLLASILILLLITNYNCQSDKMKLAEGVAFS
jgi:hypothetical protein